MDLEYVSADGQFVVWVEPLLLDPFTVHLRAVAAVEVPDMPEAIGKFELAMVARYVGKPEDDVRALPATDCEDRLEERNRVAAANGKEFTEHEPGLP